MSKPVPLDSRNRELHVGDFVCYSVTQRGAGLEFGHVFKISEKEVTRYRYDDIAKARTPTQDLEFKITVARTDAFGNPIWDTVWDSAAGKHISTDRQSKSGRIDHFKSKFLIMP